MLTCSSRKPKYKNEPGKVHDLGPLKEVELEVHYPDKLRGSSARLETRPCRRILEEPLSHVWSLSARRRSSRRRPAPRAEHHPDGRTGISTSEEL